MELVQRAINPHLTLADVREMLIQHLLTEEIFTSVFNEAQFHRETTSPANWRPSPRRFLPGP